MEIKRVAAGIYVFTLAVLVFNIVFWIAYSGLSRTAIFGFVDTEAERCSFFHDLFLTVCVVALLSFVSVALKWPGASWWRRAGMLTSSLAYLVISYFNFLAWGFCGG